MQVGSELKAARKKTGISVEVISKRTKITVSKLVALEKNDFKNLPTGLYLFSAVRAYAREVHIDPEPIVERLRAEFADKDALDALQVLNAAGALHAKHSANAKGSREGQSNLLRNSAIAAGVVLMAAAGAAGGAYLHNMDQVANEVRSTQVERPSAAPPSSPAPAATAATAVDVPLQAAPAAPTPPLTKPNRAKARTSPVTPRAQDAAGPVDIDSPTPVRIEEPADTPATAP
jgi:cytoskeleton protein RodZ